MISTVIKSWGEVHSESIIFENDQIQICDKILLSSIWFDATHDIDSDQQLRRVPCESIIFENDKIQMCDNIFMSSIWFGSKHDTESD